VKRLPTNLQMANYKILAAKKIESSSSSQLLVVVKRIRVRSKKRFNTRTFLTSMLFRFKSLV